MKRQGRVFMWLDNASDIDILFYEPYARIIADIAKNEQYNPLTVGVFGLWGAGKSTLLKLIGEKLKSQDGIICVTINAWMFESYDDAKTAIMEALLQELKEEVPVEETKKKLGKLIKRVDWFKLGTKAISTLAPVVASVATGNPLPMLLNVTGSAEEIGNTVKNAANSIQSLKDEYWKEEDASNDESTINNIRKFREEFSDALKSDDIKNVVVMIDDLDRCRPERIIEILEVIKLFLSVDRTTFIIAADENVIKYSIREKYPPMNGFDVELDKEYIEKIIQLPIYIPELSAKDIQNYLLLLVTQSYLEQESFKHLIDKIFEEKRTISGDVITLEEINKSIGELGLNWQDGGQTAFNETAKIIDEIREIVEQIVRVCAEKDKLMSVHLRRAEEEAISILKKYRPRRCIIHWFNGNGEQLQQLVDIGCYFSLNSNMVTNEKNKEKLYLIPKTRVLIESDGPFTKIDGKKYTFNNLIKIYELVARYYNEPDIIKMVYANFRDILSK